MFDGLSCSLLSVMFDGLSCSFISVILMVSRVHLHPYPFLLLAIPLLELMYKCNV